MSSNSPHDPLNLHEKLTSDWQDVFAEAGGTTTPDKIWNCYQAMYKILYKVFYLIPALLIGPFVVIGIALYMAWQNFVLFWICQPSFVCFKNWMFVQEKFFSVILETFMKPTFRVMGYCFSEFRVRYQKFEDNQNTDIFIV